MSKHTPGPWKVVENGNPLSSGIVAIIQHSPERLLTVEEDHFGGPWCAPDTWEANGRLIAAAPDLLEALSIMYDYHHADECKLGDDTAECLMMRAAIAKAEGR